MSSAAQAFYGQDTDPSCTWLLDYLRTLPPWVGVYPPARQRPLGTARRRGLGGASDDGEDGDSEDSDGDVAEGLSDSGGGVKRRRHALPAEDSRGSGSASQGRQLRSGKILPVRRVMPLPCASTDRGHSSCRGHPAKMPPPRELDYDSELSGGVALGFSHYNSPVYATRCDLRGPAFLTRRE